MEKKLITIVGMGPGVALAVAEQFGREGFEIAMIARRQSALEDLQQQLKAKSITAHWFVADASNEQELTSTLDQIQSRLGKIDVLHYNAAHPRMQKPLEADVQEFVNDFQVNVVGGLVSAKTVAPSMVERKQGTILITGGGFGLYPTADFFALGIGKAGSRHLAFDLHEELSPKGVRVGTVTVMGTIKEGTPINASAVAEKFYQLHLGKPTDPCEIQFTGE